MGAVALILNIAEFTRELVGLPDRLTTKANPIVTARAEAARDRVAAAYPFVTGQLRSGVVSDTETTLRGRVRVTVKSTAPYAAPYEFAPATGGPRPTFVPITQQERLRMVRELVAMTRGEGFTVTGDDV